MTFKGLTATVAVLAALAAAPVPAFAEDLTAVDIVRSLKPTSVTRSIGGGPKISVEDQEMLDDLANGSRSIGVRERVELKVVVETYDMPKLDLDIPFDYDSYTITPAAAKIIDQLAKALLELKGKYVLTGHTDARGSNDYNQYLSEQRAWAVRDYLVEYYGIDYGSLIATGYGEDDLKDPAYPDDGINRRVTVINLVAQK